AISGTNPKEVAIAMDVLGREADFDVGKDSIVRVHVYHLRNKLSAYYARAGASEKWRIDIPKGQYMLVATPNEAPAEPAVSVTGQPLQRKSYAPWLAAAAIALLVLNLVWGQRETPVDATGAANPFAATGLWQPLLDDTLPVLVIVGDYYIMGETDANGNVRRMVREFDINSRQDLQELQMRGGATHYFNLDLSYTPTSVAPALAQIMRVFGTDAARVNVKMISQLRTTDLVGNHIVYLGYLSGMQNLTDLMFAASGLSIGMTYDELVELDNNTSFRSSSGLSVGENAYRDYGMLSTFPAPSGNQFVMLAGMRDEGLINLSEEVASLASLQRLEDAVAASGEAAADGTAFEALYEVLGYDNTNFDARLVYSRGLDTKIVWETRLVDAP
ncbi:MAG: hypothetical protein SV422_13105, partial [Pseudomonadota bacterium]|nr:hypothetical protein [Pseudomonadota bacterium]